MAENLTLKELLNACSQGGAHCLTSVTDLEPAAGPHAAVAPAKFAASRPGDTRGQYAYETRYGEDGTASSVVLIDSKQSQLNRLEASLNEAIQDGHEVLERLPRIVVEYDGVAEFSDLELPHRAFDGHLRAGTVDGRATTDHEAYLTDYRAYLSNINQSAHH